MEKPIQGSEFIWPTWDLENSRKLSLSRLVPECAELEDPYLDLSGDVSTAYEYKKDHLEVESAILFSKEVSHPEAIDTADDKGYASDVESNNEFESVKPEISPPQAASTAFDTPENSRHNGEAPRVQFGSTVLLNDNRLRKQQGPKQSLHGEFESPKGVSTSMETVTATNPASPTASRKSLGLRKSLDQLRTKIVRSLTSTQKDAANASLRLPSCSYDADAELSEPSPPPPSMGSRQEWERKRLERNKRYVDTIESGPFTESDEETSKGLQPSRSPTTVRLDGYPAASEISPEQDDTGRDFYTGELRYAIEAIERSNADEIEDEVSASHSPQQKTHDRNDSGVFFDCQALQIAPYGPAHESDSTCPIDQPRQVSSTTIFRQGWDLLERDLLPSADVYDPYQAALIAAGLSQDPALESQSVFAPHGSNERDMLFESIMKESFPSAPFSLEVKHSPSILASTKSSPEIKQLAAGPLADGDDDISLCELGEAASTSSDLDDTKSQPLRPNPEAATSIGEITSITSTRDHRIVQKSTDTVDLATVFLPRLRPNQAPAELISNGSGGRATVSPKTPKGERNITPLSKMTPSPCRDRSSLQVSIEGPSSDKKLKRDYDRFDQEHSNSSKKLKRANDHFNHDDNNVCVSNDNSVSYGEDLSSPQSTPPFLQTCQLKENDPPRPGKGSDASPCSHKPMGLMRHLEAKAARRLMQVVYRLEAEDSDEDEDAGSGSEWSRYDNISID